MAQLVEGCGHAVGEHCKGEVFHQPVGGPAVLRTLTRCSERAATISPISLLTCIECTPQRLASSWSLHTVLDVKLLLEKFLISRNLFKCDNKVSQTGDITSSWQQKNPAN